MLRLWFVIVPADAPAVLTEPEIMPFDRVGFSVMEWGGVVK